MRTHPLKIILILLIITFCQNATLEGTWILSNISNSLTIPFQVKLTIKDVVYRSSIIKQTFVFSGCQQFMYLGTALDNNLFIDYSTFYSSSIIGSNNQTVTCTTQQTNFNALIQSNFLKTFYFQIFGNYLSFIGPDQQNLITFSRDMSSSSNSLNLRGKWIITRINNVPTSQSLSISDTQMNLCQGALDVSIKYNSKNKIKLAITRNDNCSQPNLVSAIQNSIYYRFNDKNNITMFYSQDISSTIIISFIENITNQQYLTDKQAVIAAITPIPQTKSNQTSTIPFQLSNNQDDLIGQWSPSNIFGIPLSNSPISIVFTYTTITYQGGCNNYIFAYTINISDTKKQLTIGQNKTSTKNCSVNDDGLYTTGISMFSSYNISINPNTSSIIMNVLSSNGSNIMQLTRPIPIITSLTSNPNSNISNTNKNSSTSSQTTTNTSSKPVLSLIPNTYVFLILARRDIPRIFCNITTSQITYTGCNKITHIFQANPDGTIIITGQSVGNNKTCATNNDVNIYNTFNSAKYYKAGEIGSFILQDQNKKDIINLSLF